MTLLLGGTRRGNNAFAPEGSVPFYTLFLEGRNLREQTGMVVLRVGLKEIFSLLMLN